MGTTFEDTIIQLYDAKGKQQTRYFFHVMKKNNKFDSSPIYVNNFHNTTTKNLLNVLGYLPVFRYQRMTTYLQGSILIVK